VIEIIRLHSHQALSGSAQRLIRVQVVCFLEVSLRFVVLCQLRVEDSACHIEFLSAWLQHQSFANHINTDLERFVRKANIGKIQI